MNCALTPMLSQSQNMQSQDKIIKNSPQKESYPLFQTQLHQLQICQMFTEIQGDVLEFKQINNEKHQKTHLFRQKFIQNFKQLPSLTLQLHKKFIQQKQKELVQLLILSFTILSFIVLIWEYYKQKKQIGYYEN